MLSANLIRMIADHWEEISERVLRRVRRDSKLLEFGKLPEPELRERAREILQNLGRFRGKRTWRSATSGSAVSAARRAFRSTRWSTRCTSSKSA